MRTECLNRDELVAFNLGELPAELLEEIAAHMETCPRCEGAACELDGVSSPLVDAYRRSVQTGRMDIPTRTPQQVGDYTILEELGRGGMGVVYRARHQRLQRVVALKMLIGGSFALHDELARFRVEAEAVARLHHTNIVQIYEIGEYDADTGLPRPYFTLEFVEGGSLAARAAGRPQAAGQSAAWIEALARATHYAHGQGIIHRDLKPGNVLLTADGQPKICDFGVAKLVASSDLKTQSGMLVGTAEYMAPEQATGNSTPGPAVDIYALGAILYTLLTGRPPFHGVSPLHTLEQVRTQEPVTPGRLQPLIPRDLETICLKCLEKDPNKRYASALDLADDLQRFLCDEPVRARRATVWERAARWTRRHKSVTLALSAVILSMAIATAFSTYEAVLKEAERVKARNAESAALEAGNLAREERDRVARNLYLARAYLVGQSLDTPAGLSQVERLFNDWRGRSLHGDPRGWEWYYFQTLANRSERTLHGHALDVTSLAWSRDGSRLASGSLDQSIRLWDAANGFLLATFKTPPGILGLSWSPDGKRFASADFPGRTVSVWDAHTGVRLHTMAGHQADVWWVAWSPDNEHLGSADSDGTIIIWHEPERRRVLELKGAHRRAGFGWSPDGRRLAAANSASTVAICDAGTGKVLQTLPDQPNVTSAIWSPDGKRLATLSQDRGITVWDDTTGKELKRLPVYQPEDFPGSLSWSPNGRRLALSRLDLAISVWDIDSGREQVLRGHTGSHISTVCWSPDGSRLASAERGWNGTIKIWNANSLGESQSPSIASFSEQTNLAWSPDSRMWAAAHQDRMIRIWDSVSQRCLSTLKPDEAISRLSWSPDGRLLAGGSDKGTLYIWDWSIPKLLASHTGNVSGIASLTWSKDSTKLGYAKNHSEFGVWDSVRGNCNEMPHIGIRGVLSPDGNRVAAGLSYGIRIVDSTSGQELISWPNSEVTHNYPQWNPDGTRVATTADFAVEIRDAATGRIPFPPLVHSRRVVAFAWSPNGTQMITCTDDHDLHMWDVAEGNAILSLRGPARAILNLSWSPDSTRIAACSDDGKLTLWDATPGFAGERAPATLAGLGVRLQESPKDLNSLRQRASVYARLGDWTNASGDASRLTTESQQDWFQAGWWVENTSEATTNSVKLDPFASEANAQAALPRWYISADDPNGFVPVQFNQATYLSRLYAPRPQIINVELTSALGLDTTVWLNGISSESKQGGISQLRAGWNTLAVRVEERTPSSNVLLRHGTGFYLRLKPSADPGS